MRSTSKDTIPIPYNGIDLVPFSNADAGLVPQILTGYNMDDNHITFSEDIAEKLGGLPLAVVQIAETVIRRDLSLLEFLELFEHDSDRLEFYRPIDAGTLPQREEVGRNYPFCVGPGRSRTTSF